VERRERKGGVHDRDRLRVPVVRGSPDGQAHAVTDGIHGRLIIVDRSGRELNRM
jgi:hypothetical protein